ncbi:MAG: hypothetical protein KDA61_16450 [Planctomycetales bacterium]|nr:hypothetical protein [Planctomycetales bacterium]
MVKHWLVFLLSWILILSGMEKCGLAASPLSPLREAQIEAQVQQALAAELVGDLAARDAKLTGLLEIEPNAAAPHWHLGEVLCGGRWLTVEEAAEDYSQDPNYADYRALRAQLPDTPEAHLEAADWCEARGMDAERQLHLRATLSYDPDNYAAQRRLGVRRYGNAFFTAAEVAARKEESDRRQVDFDRFHAEITSWIATSIAGSLEDREDLLQRIIRIEEPRAATAVASVVYLNRNLQAQVAHRLKGDESSSFPRALRQSAVASLKNMPVHEATVALLQMAVFDDDESVRYAATDALKLRPPTDFIPLLMESLRAPIEHIGFVDFNPAGTLAIHEEIRQATPFGEHVEIYDRQHRIVGRPGRPIFEHKLNLMRQQAVHPTELASPLAQSAMQINRELRMRNERIIPVLAQITGYNSDSPERWWNSWSRYNELSLADEPPQQTVAYCYQYTNEYVVSCFTAGAPVWTRSGVRAIETIVPGDFVLSQNPQTGELAYQPVIATTVRQPSDLVRIETGADVIEATRGHRFWVQGQGWVMAKFLEPGMTLDSVRRPQTVAHVAHGGQTVAYNLVVDRFHTYFVGNEPLLVQDCTCPPPLLGALPGMQPRLANEPQTLQWASTSGR